MAGVSVESLYQYFPARERSPPPSSIATIGRSCHMDDQWGEAVR
ncbi:hypothetical protein [Variovorax guangxiensis]|nr:hypothetical protein [Variovorax guangxiensis]